jgi:hypothetical protein
MYELSLLEQGWQQCLVISLTGVVSLSGVFLGVYQLILAFCNPIYENKDLFSSKKSVL